VLSGTCSVYQCHDFHAASSVAAATVLSDRHVELGAKALSSHSVDDAVPLPDLLAERDTHWRSLVSPLLKGDVQSKFLQGLKLPERNVVLAAGSYRQFSKLSVAAHEREPADRLFLVLRGSARYFFITPGGKQVYLLWLAPGEIFGGATLLPYPAPFLVSTEVAKDTHVLVWQRGIIRNLARRYVRLFENGLAIANDYLTWYLATHLSLISHTARQRLAHVLLSLARGIGQRSQAGVRLDITNEQLANTANITPFTASRLLSEWQRSGVIAKTRGQVVLIHPEQIVT
jgi:CRP-like cAMP-binding protein